MHEVFSNPSHLPSGCTAGFPAFPSSAHLSSASLGDLRKDMNFGFFLAIPKLRSYWKQLNVAVLCGGSPAQPQEEHGRGEVCRARNRHCAPCRMDLLW